MRLKLRIALAALAVIFASIAACQAVDYAAFVEGLRGYPLTESQPNLTASLLVFGAFTAGALLLAAGVLLHKVPLVLASLFALAVSGFHTVLGAHAVARDAAPDASALFGVVLPVSGVVGVGLSIFLLLLSAGTVGWIIRHWTRPPQKHALASRIARSGASSLAAVVLVLVSLRVAAPYVVEGVLDDSLGALPDHWGMVQDVDLALYRGVIVVEDMNILLRNADEIDRPLLAIERSEAQIDYDALFDGHLRLKLALDDARVSIVVAEHAVQTGESPTLREELLALLPLDVSTFDLRNGTFRFVDQTEDPQVNVAIQDLAVHATNISTRPPADAKTRKDKLPTKVDINGSVLGEAPLSVSLAIDSFADKPFFDLTVEMEKLPLESLKTVTRAYANFDYEDGYLSFYSELAAAKGYAKPIIANADVVDTDGNDEGDGPLDLAWESFVGAVSMLFENSGTDAVATRIPIEGRLDQPDVDVLSTVFGFVANAFFDTIMSRTDNSVSIESVMRAPARG